MVLHTIHLSFSSDISPAQVDSAIKTFPLLTLAPLTSSLTSHGLLELMHIRVVWYGSPESREKVEGTRSVQPVGDMAGLMAELVRVDALRNERVRKKRANHWLEGMKDGKKARGGGSEEVGSLVVTGKESGEGPLSFEEKAASPSLQVAKRTLPHASRLGVRAATFALPARPQIVSEARSSILDPDPVPSQPSPLQIESILPDVLAELRLKISALEAREQVVEVREEALAEKWAAMERRLSALEESSSSPSSVRLPPLQAPPSPPPSISSEEEWVKIKRQIRKDIDTVWSQLTAKLQKDLKERVTDPLKQRIKRLESLPSSDGSVGGSQVSSSVESEIPRDPRLPAPSRVADVTSDVRTLMKLQEFAGSLEEIMTRVEICQGSLESQRKTVQGVSQRCSSIVESVEDVRQEFRVQTDRLAQRITSLPSPPAVPTRADITALIETHLDRFGGVKNDMETLDQRTQELRKALQEQTDSSQASLETFKKATSKDSTALGQRIDDLDVSFKIVDKRANEGDQHRAWTDECLTTMRSEVESMRSDMKGIQPESR